MNNKVIALSKSQETLAQSLEELAELARAGSLRSVALVGVDRQVNEYKGCFNVETTGDVYELVGLLERMKHNLLWAAEEVNLADEEEDT